MIHPLHLIVLKHRSLLREKLVKTQQQQSPDLRLTSKPLRVQQLLQAERIVISTITFKHQRQYYL